MYFEPISSFSNHFPVTPFHIGEYPNQLPVNRPNGYNWNLFLWVTKGECVLEIGDTKTILTEGHGFFSKKNIPYAYTKTSEIFSTQWVAFSGGEQLFSHFNTEDYFLFDTPKSLPDSALQLEKVCTLNSAPVRAAQTYLWVTEFLDKLSCKKTSLSEKITDYLEENCHQQITLNEIAEHFKTDKYILCHKYNADTGTSVMKALKNIRLKKAKQLLKYCDYSVEDVAYLCGYESASYFIKLFREETGITPRQYRKKT